MRVVVDVMGGDHGCGVVIEGVRRALESGVEIGQVHLVGNRRQMEAALEAVGCHDSRLVLHHASQVLDMTDHPVSGLRRKKDCSMARAVDLVKQGEADTVISPGNTGGLVAVSTIKLRTLASVDRPAIATVMPSGEGTFVLLDAGATPRCKPLHLMQFAVMGSIYSREILGYPHPRVGILSNGREGIKGVELTRQAARLCELQDLNFLGYVEGHDLFADHVDVVVADGFVGNIVLKSCEALSRAITGLLRAELAAAWPRRLGAWLSRGAFQTLKRRMDPDLYGGAPLLGLKGNVIKAHGSAREDAIMSAVRLAAESVQHHLDQLILHEVTAANERAGLLSKTAAVATA